MHFRDYLDKLNLPDAESLSVTQVQDIDVLYSVFMIDLLWLFRHYAYS